MPHQNTKSGAKIDAMEKTNSIVNNQITGDKPDHFAFIIGAMKSGTTSLFEILSQHPQVCPSKIKEPVIGCHVTMKVLNIRFITHIYISSSR